MQRNLNDSNCQAQSYHQKTKQDILYQRVSIDVYNYCPLQIVSPYWRVSGCLSKEVSTAIVRERGYPVKQRQYVRDIGPFVKIIHYISN